MAIRSLVALGAAEDLLRELCYCDWAGWSWRHGGRLGRVQQRALDKGWLLPRPMEPGRLELSAAGRLAIPRLAATLPPGVRLQRQPGRARRADRSIPPPLPSSSARSPSSPPVSTPLPLPAAS